MAIEMLDGIVENELHTDMADKNVRVEDPEAVRLVQVSTS